VRQHLLAPVAALATLALATPARAQVVDPVPYTLTSPSDLGYGCAQPCMCAWFRRGPLNGGFMLHLASVDGFRGHYEVLDFTWRWELPDSAGGTRTVALTGHGTYDAQALPGVGSQRIQLDLTTEDGFEHHFDSHSVVGPRSDTLEFEIPMGHACHDSVLRVVAVPQDEHVPPAVPGVRLAAAPNPARADADFVLVLPEAAAGKVEVVGVSGQIVAVIAKGVFPAGESRWHWDGRNAAGTDAGVGVFWVRARLDPLEVRMACPDCGGAAGPRTLIHSFVRLR